MQSGRHTRGRHVLTVQPVDKRPGDTLEIVAERCVDRRCIGQLYGARIHVHAVTPVLVMQMRAGRQAGLADIGN